ncbi:MAG: hypothetical protein ACRDD7_11870, partial [Peptostreptococcaceae bacterium]
MTTEQQIKDKEQQLKQLHDELFTLKRNYMSDGRKQLLDKFLHKFITFNGKEFHYITGVNHHEQLECINIDLSDGD